VTFWRTPTLSLYPFSAFDAVVTDRLESLHRHVSALTASVRVLSDRLAAAIEDTKELISSASQRHSQCTRIREKIEVTASFRVAFELTGDESRVFRFGVTGRLFLDVVFVWSS
jgi:hypothetical protein